MPITVADGFLDQLRGYSGAVHVELRSAAPAELADIALHEARRALHEVPHPLEPEDPFVSYVSDIIPGPRGPRFWFDAADAESFPGIPEALIEAIRTGLERGGLTDGEISWPDRPE